MGRAIPQHAVVAEQDAVVGAADGAAPDERAVRPDGYAGLRGVPRRAAGQRAAVVRRDAEIAIALGDAIAQHAAHAGPEAAVAEALRLLDGDILPGDRVLADVDSTNGELSFEKTQNTLILGEGAAVCCLEIGKKENALAFVEGIGYATEVNRTRYAVGLGKCELRSRIRTS